MPKLVVADEPDDITGIRLVHRLAFVAEEFVRGLLRRIFRWPVHWCVTTHVALELAAAHAQERDAVAVLAGPCSLES
jgi:hypothetical protein